MTAKKLISYTMLEQIGKGEMSQVYMARNQKSGTLVAVKILKNNLLDPDQNHIDSFFNSGVKIIQTLDHPNIVRLLDYGKNKGRYYLIYEYIEGISLASYMAQNKRLSLTAIEQISVQILKALAYAHSKYILHRDIKPQNILITSEGKVKITDFGIPYTFSSWINNPVDSFKGYSPAYISPEQADRKNTDNRSDIYSFGIVLFQMLAGQLPFKSDTREELIRQHLTQAPPDIKSFNRAVPDHLAYIVAKCIVKDPKGRFSNVLEIVKLLKSGKLSKTATPPANEPALKSEVKKLTKKTKIIISIVSALILLLAIIIPVVTSQANREEPLGIIKEGANEPVVIEEAVEETKEVAAEKEEETEIIPEESIGIILDPDKSWIAFTGESGEESNIYIMDIEGEDLIQITDNNSIDFALSWSPDGKKLAFTSDRDGNYEIYIMDYNGENQKRLTNDKAWDSLPCWSPDGSKIAFRSNRDGDTEIYTMESNGENIMKLTNNNSDDGSPSWSPDGSKIVFTSDRDGGAEIYLMDLDGNNIVKLTDNSKEDAFPSWSPDGSMIVYTSVYDEYINIDVMDSNGKNKKRLTDGDTLDLMPSWSPDSSKIAFNSNIDGDFNIYTIDSNGNNLKKITNDLFTYGWATWFPGQIKD